ncbi:MAG TPA: ATP-binding protein [Pedococcus sp.]|jgi:sensor histidine kinase regulating citrate/malate metabolism|uniref:sensor histidine kinase n=1 Tax=Pedococcus sp. TaxID=2860345 RepID=UPI002F94159B
MRALRRSTLAGQLLAFQLALVMVVLVFVGAVSLAQSEATFTRVEGRRVAALAEQLAASPLVRSNLAEPEQRTGLATLAQQVVVQSRVDTVTLAEADEEVRVSSDPSLEGARIPLGAPGVGAGASWSGTLETDGRRQLVAQVPVLSVETDRVGEHLGTVMIAVDFPSAWERLGGASSYLLTYLGIASVLGLGGSWLLARRIKRQTLGLEPREIAGLAEHREAMLYGIAEGVIALDPQHRITLVNDVAARLLDLPEHSVGMSLSDLRIEGRLYDVLAGGPDDGETAGDGTAEGHGADAAAEERTGDGAARMPRDEVVIRRGRVLVMNRMTVTKDGRRLGTVTTLRDRTELANLEREIGSFRSSTQLLRAQAHEFANQLHTISGLIQIGDFDEVVRYVDAVSRHRESLDLSVNRRVRDSAVAALLMAKASLASERRVELRVSEDTSLEQLEPADSADVATVVGNLVDNALDAATGSSDAWVEIALRQDAATVEVVVRDSGPGVAPEVAHEVFTHGFTTKAAQSGERGIGLALTRLVCQRRGGEVTLANTEDGAMFTAHLTVTPVAPIAQGVS